MIVAMAMMGMGLMPMGRMRRKMTVGRARGSGKLLSQSLVSTCILRFALSSARTIIFFFLHSYRLSPDARQHYLGSRHWSRRVTADNPHGFTDKPLARLRAIEDPAEREKEEQRLLWSRESSAKWRSDPANRKKEQEKRSGEVRRKKIDAE
jgi:hypothetical protein